MGVSSFLTAIIKISFLFFFFPSPSSPHVSCTAAAAAMKTMEKKGRATYALLPFFQDNRPIKLLSRQWLWWSSLYMQLQCFERLGTNVQTTFDDCSQTRLCIMLILIGD